eukprot:16432923-Heterocapsa_arctica.AAC.1
MLNRPQAPTPGPPPTPRELCEAVSADRRLCARPCLGAAGRACTNGKQSALCLLGHQGSPHPKWSMYVCRSCPSA